MVPHKRNKFTLGKLVKEDVGITYQVQSRNIDNYIEIPTKYQKLTMETLFVRFPHLVEDIFGLVNGKTLSCCSQINNT